VVIFRRSLASLICSPTVFKMSSSVGEMMVFFLPMVLSLNGEYSVHKTP
jgi:hypothetical protein